MDVKFFDSLYEGDSAKGVRLGMGLTGGDFWARCGGCQNLYRGGSMQTIDFTNILATGDICGTVMSPPSWLEHQPSSTYFYVVRRVNCCGVEEHSLCGSVKIVLDGAGELAEPRCNNVFSVKAQQVFCDKVRLLWYYWPIEQDSLPGCFRIYSDGGCGTIDYENAVAEIDYVGQRFYSWQSGSLGGEKYLFCIRAVSQAGVEGEFAGEVRIDLDRTRPEAIEIFHTEVI